jgi:uncharacterized protein (TIGR03083 family)
MTDPDPTSPARSPIDHLAHLAADSATFATVLDVAPLDTPVPGCPGWSLERLGRHIGQVQRWARSAAEHRAQPPQDIFRSGPGDGTALADWVRQGTAELLVTLGALDPDGPTWHLFPAPMLARVWPRRQAQEISIHRFDAQSAVGTTDPIDPDLASDGIDEYFEVMLPRLLQREERALPAGSLHVHCTDVHGEWIVRRAAGGGVEMERAHTNGDAALRGPAATLLLALWGRAVDRTGIDVAGDHAVADAWLGVGSV